MKTCKVCNTNKELLEYHRPTRNVCKVCVAAEKKLKQAQYDQTATGITKQCRVCNETKSGECFRYDSNQCRECILKKQNRVANRPTDDMPPKTCTKCGTEQPATCFRHRTCVCKDCEKRDMYEWREKNPERFKEHLQKYRSSEQYKEKRQMYLKEKYHSDIHNRITQLHRTRIRSALKGGTKCKKSMELLGCGIEAAKEWLEFNFHEDMSWDNFGEYWHIDHIKPCSSFDLSQDDQQSECFHWSNLAPMLKVENLRKGAKVDAVYIRAMRERAHEFYNQNPYISQQPYTATSSN